MKNEQADANNRLKELLNLARKIESLTAPSKDPDDSD